MENKRDFNLPENDILYLDSTSYTWRAITSLGMQWLIIDNYPITKGFNVNKASIALKIETGYPRLQIDMAYFSPALQLSNGKSIYAICNQQIGDTIFQRWSRHRPSSNPWREGIDCVSSHLSFVNSWLENELKR